MALPGTAPFASMQQHRDTRVRPVRVILFVIFASLSMAVFSVLGRKPSHLADGESPESRARNAATFRFATPMPDFEPYEVHPIHDLMARARKEWEEKVERQSNTFEEAVVEYRRRYSREPPHGFEVWYSYAKLHDVALIDEFDQIDFDLAPFFALPPSEINDRFVQLEEESPNHAFLRIRNNKISWTGARWRDVIPDLFVAETGDALAHLPDMDIPLFLHDGPFNYLDATAKLGYLGAAKAGRWVNETELSVDGKTVWQDRSRTCLPNSRFHRAESGLENEHPGVGPGFIYELNPKNEIPFLDKPHSKLLWRGSPDGTFVGQENTWRRTHRFRALYLTNSNDTTRTRKIRLTNIDHWGKEYQLDREVSLAQLNERYTNVKATAIAVQCEPDLCAHVEYSARFRTHLHSNQVPLKSTRYGEWYTGRIMPWLHYVPLKEDYSDLYNILGFFSGDLSANRVGHHDLMAESIAVEGRKWAERFWRPEDTKAYLLRLLLEYARLVDTSREASGKTSQSAAWEGRRPASEQQYLGTD
ncbi:hypothetical protein RQP46_000839 [Phenoliferia psychrophenolica]